MLQKFDDGLSDMRAGIGMWRVWVALAGEDISDQHRRTTLGPLWLLINYLAFAGTFVFVFRHGDSGATNYAAYVAIGLFVWFYLMETVNQGVSLFLREESFIKGTTLPLSVYIMRLATQVTIRAIYAFAGCLAILLVSGVDLSPAWGWSALGIIVIVVTTPAVIILCAFLGAYLPDSQFIVSNLMRLGMFLTPVFWMYEGAGGVRGAFYFWNPFTYFLEIVRAPILTGEVPICALALCLGIGLAAWVLALILFAWFRRDVVFVL